MARIVFAAWGSLGDLHPYMALALELKRRGHEVIVAAMPSVRANVERAGLEFRPVRPDVAPDHPDSRDVVRKILDVRTGPEFLFRQVLAPQMRETYDDTLAAVKNADVLVSHQLPVTSPIVVEHTGIPWVSGVLAPLAFLSAYDPPTLSHVPWLRPVASLHPAIGGVLRQLARAATRPWLKSWYQLRKDLFIARGAPPPLARAAGSKTRSSRGAAGAGMPPNAHPLFEGQHAPSCVLALFSRLLAEKQPDYPPQTVITGFPFYDAAPQHPPDPGLLRFLDPGEPPIVFTLGSSAVWVADDFYAVSMAAARALGRRAVLLAGENAAAMRAQAPDGIGVFDYAPHSIVMPRAGLIAPGRDRNDRAGAPRGTSDACRAVRPGSARQRTPRRPARRGTHDLPASLPDRSRHQRAVGVAVRSGLCGARRWKWGRW
jgi:UDP:flavonoid glycosyltransferase YjiC (YdhE family)